MLHIAVYHPVTNTTTTELLIFTVHVMPHIALSQPVTNTTELKKAANIDCPCDATHCSLFLLLIPLNPKAPNLYWPGTRRQWPMYKSKTYRTYVSRVRSLPVCTTWFLRIYTRKSFSVTWKGADQPLFRK